MARLTPKSVDAEKPGKSRREIPDDGATGLYLLVQPTGSKSWAIRYRSGGRPVKHSLGKYPLIQLAEARELAAAEMNKIAHGGDPAADRRLNKREYVPAIRTVEAVFEEYRKNHLSTLKSEDVIVREMRRHFVIPWGHRDIKSLKRSEIYDLLEDVAENKGNGRKGQSMKRRGVTANRLRTYISGMIGWCFDKEIVPVNVASRMKSVVKEVSRERVLTEDELRNFMKACKSAPHPWGSFGMLLLLTGQRLSEVAGMTSSEVEGNMWTIPEDRSKNGNEHLVPLSEAAMAIIEGLPVHVIEGIGFGYYFTTNKVAQVSGFSHAKEMIENGMPEGTEHWTFHDLRRTMTTMMEEMGVRLVVTEAILNHTSGSKKGVAKVYHRAKHLKKKAKALNKWSKSLERIRNDV